MTNNVHLPSTGDRKELITYQKRDGTAKRRFYGQVRPTLEQVVR